MGAGCLTTTRPQVAGPPCVSMDECEPRPPHYLLPTAGPAPICSVMTGTPITGQSRSQALAAVVVVAAAAGAAVTFISLVPFTTVAYHSPMLHVAIETAITLIALFGAALLVGRFMRAPTWPELLLAGALLLLALTNLCFAVVPWITDGEPGSFHTWTPVAGRLLGAAGLAAGALLPAVPVRRPRRALLQTLAAVGSVLVAVGIAGALIAPHLPVGIDPALPPDPSGPNLVGEPVLLACQAISLVLYSIAAGGLIRRARRGGDERGFLATQLLPVPVGELGMGLYRRRPAARVLHGDPCRCPARDQRVPASAGRGGGARRAASHCEGPSRRPRPGTRLHSLAGAPPQGCGRRAGHPDRSRRRARARRIATGDRHARAAGRRVARQLGRAGGRGDRPPRRGRASASARTQPRRAGNGS